MPRTTESSSEERLCLTFREVGYRLSISERSAWGLVKTGQLPAIRFNRSVRVPVSALEEFVAQRTSPQPSDDFQGPEAGEGRVAS